MTDSDQDITIATIEKNRSEAVRIALKEFKGRHYLDIRTYIEPYADEGQGRVPTRKGVTVPLAKLPALIEGLQAAERRARDKGLLQDDQQAA